MTVDDLRNLYNRAFSRVPEASGLLAQQDAGIKAVVLALRDEIFKYGGALGAPEYLVRLHVKMQFDEILGDAGEKVAGGPTREDEQGVGSNELATLANASTDPATNPSPAVCEWQVRDKYTVYVTPCDKRRRVGLIAARWDLENCPSCGKPIKFTEANHG